MAATIMAASGYGGTAAEPKAGPGLLNDKTNGTADYDQNKRKVVWEIKDFKGGQSKTLKCSLTYEKDVIIDEF